MKTCTECGGQIEDSSLHDFHYVIATCVKNLQARVEKSEAAAIEFATCTFNDLSERVNHKDTEKWREVYEDRDDAKSAASYLLTVGLLEKHPTLENYRWVAPVRAEEAAGKQQ